MSRDSQEMRETRAALLAELARELRQFNGLSASYFRAVAARSGMTATDMQVIDMLDGAGPMTAGQLADLTGLTTGAITGMLKRLEEARIVRRESLTADDSRFLQPLEHASDRAGGQTCQIGKLSGGHWASAIQHIDDLHIRRGHPAARRHRTEVGRAQPVELPQLARQLG